MKQFIRSANLIIAKQIYAEKNKIFFFEFIFINHTKNINNNNINASYTQKYNSNTHG